MVQSIDRAVSIIELLASNNDREWWSISEISERLHLPVSTSHRLLNTLIRHGLVFQNPETKQYKLGYLWIEIGLRQLEKLDFRSVAREVMKRLALQVEESIYLNIPDGTDALIIERVDSPTNVRIIDKLGLRIPLHIGAANKTILANMNSKEMDIIVNKLIPDSSDKYNSLIEQLFQIKRQGYAVSYSERTEGTLSVAAPILDFNHKVVGALSIGVLNYRVKEERLLYLIDRVKEAANEISIAIGRTS
ncbi:IclR family transcriptional regulator [Bacillus sp. 03113]|uniref:IclR family transcriptional regulator n=1 Tax=Bacillus sp. 03113 TaxID=2578211 RepID=UPI001144B22A|nr:IclR family transcriptional regulator [Bacillus sp. 03113]